MRKSLSSRRGGWSLIELTIILIVLSILCAILMPVIGRYVRNAKIIRCREDVGALSCSIWLFIQDTGSNHFLRNGSPILLPHGSAHNRVNLLVGDGDIPELGADGDPKWVLKVNFAGIDFMEYHLVTNRPGNAASHAYPTPTDLNNPPADPMFACNGSGGFNSEFAWRGPYITAPIDPDPWGNRYAANVKFLDPRAGNGLGQDVVVLSAGPDEEVDTDADIDGITPGDDDLICVVSGNSRP